MEKILRTNAIIIVLIILITAISAITWSGYNRLSVLSNRLDLLDNKLASTTAELSDSFAKNQMILSDALNQQRQNVGNIEQKLGTYQKEVGSFSSTVTTLQKLSKTDPQLLSKYSKIFFLSENYAPARLTEIPNKYKYSDSKILKIHAQVWTYLQKMIDESAKTNIQIYVDSAYRSFTEQWALKGQYKVIYGAGSANQFSADQGYSEHQLGTTVDLITSGLEGQLEGFEKTKAYDWLINNAYKYGFILSYPKDNKFYVFEPWHWRFVGVKLATDLHTQGKNFYDLDQRDIDEYLVSIFD
ncbi:MAG: M15 family metallopeptidase [Candidatus Taylorbacteria bacterium]|nr:M15 family metallopeptidase [Candidatus Taylorbacteria bacterium]